MLKERKETLASTMGFIANTDVVYPGVGIPRDLPLTRLGLMLEGRMTVSSQTVAGTFFPESPQTLIRRIRVRGTKVSGGGIIELVNLRGEEASYLTRAYDQYTPVGANQNSSGSSSSYVAGTPGSGGVAWPQFPAATANNSYDFRTWYVVPFAPPFAVIQDETQGILDPSIFSQLDLIVSFGDQTYLINGQTATVALSAFGSATGTPSVRVTRFAPLAEGLPIMRYHYTVISKYINTGAVLGATGPQQMIQNINAGNRLRSISLRQYSEQSGQQGLISFTGSGAAAVSAARPGDNSNPGIYNWYIKLNGAVKWQMQNQDALEYDRKTYLSVAGGWPTGYALVEWGDRGFVNDTAFDTRGYGATATRFELWGDTLSLTAQDRLDMLHIEQVPVEV